MDEVLEELDEPVMPDSDDDLEDLQAEEKERDEDRYALLCFDTAPPRSSRIMGPQSSSTLPPETGGTGSDSSLTRLFTSFRDVDADLSATHSVTSDSGHTESDLSLTHLLTSDSGHTQSDLSLSHSLTSGSGHMETDPPLTHSLTSVSGHTEVHPSPIQSPPTSEVWSDKLTPVDISPFVHPVGPTFDVEGSPKKVFQHFFTGSLTSHIVTQTNIYASQVMGEERYIKWDKVTENKLMAYLGFAILMGIVQMPAINDYWRRDPFFHYAPIADRISRDRFRDIHRFLHFANNNDLPPRGQPGHDRLGKVRPVLTTLLNQFVSSYNPHCEQAIDEAMIPFQGRSTLKQYMPAKPIKRGIKAWCRADSRNGYMCEFQIYMGAQSSGEGMSLGERVVLDLSQRLQGLHYHLYFDNFFTSTSLLSHLMSVGLYGCGTIRQTSKGFPEELKMEGKGKKAQQQHNLINRYMYALCKLQYVGVL